MGTLDDALGKAGEISLSPQESYAAIAVAAVTADTQIGPEEVERVAYDLLTIRHFKSYNIRDLAIKLDQVSSLIKQKGRGPVLKAARVTLSKEQLGSAFFLAADLALADGIVGKAEREFLEELRQILGIDDATAIKIVEVAVIKNKA